ncbi:hypothetical protein FA95DRAFT_614579 [Auriscalpium vulgare]|uniref:Uncharacterized protein n=1 Tax=Auriscalpium vulgare TaxID=40419 RepID=A0ACB8RDZ8_9AGAM|nr:hypothetical protein FA95DRAFT_614579 [Auriscalpium vulgare]
MAIIPLDIQAIVVDWVYRLSQHEWDVDYDTLLACALVCRAWRHLAQRLLFRRVPRDPGRDNAGGPSGIALLLDTLHARPDLAAHVQCICLFFYSEPEINAALLEVCPHVAGLSIALDARAHISHKHLFAIPQRLQYVEVCGSCEDVEALLRMWPGLRALHLVDFVVAEDDALPVSRIGIPSGVQSLRFPLGLIEWMSATAYDLPALRELELDQPDWSNTEWSSLLCASGLLPRLHTLVLFGPLPPPEILKELKELESLVFEELPVHAISLPRTLRHVGYHCVFQPWNADITILVTALHALDDLQLFTVTRRGLPAETQAALREACSEMDVEFVTFETEAHFPRPEHIDWI